MQKNPLIITIAQENHQLRLDLALSRQIPHYSRAQFQQWIKAGNVTVNQHCIQKPRHSVIMGDQVLINITTETQTTDEPEALALNIIAEDETILVINKPVGLIVHPGAGNKKHTLLNALLHHAPQLSQLPRAGIVHRLDKDTSGLLVIAKTLEAHHALIQQMQRKTVKREYWALVCGNMISGGTIDAPMGRHPTQRTKIAVIEEGKPAITHYRVLERFAHHTLLSVLLETGRTHQIRVHMAHKGYPIVGDVTYSRKRSYPTLSQAAQTALNYFHHQALHAISLTFTHPSLQKVMQWKAALPDDFAQLLETLRKS